MGPNLLAAYREYLEGMYLQSQDIPEVDQFTVPQGVQLDDPEFLEWCDFT